MSYKGGDKVDSVNVVTQIISTLGFPIACCCVLMWYINKTNKEHRDEIEKIEERHSAEVANLAEIIANNTKAINNLVIKMYPEDDKNG